MGKHRRPPHREFAPRDLGHDVTAEFVYDTDGIVGIMHNHPAAHVEGTTYPNGIYPDGRCGGFMPLEGRAEGPTWSVTSGNPDTTGFEALTLIPSSLCGACGHHGFITNGRWQPA